MLQILKELISPKFCIACNIPGSDVCTQCLESWRPQSLRNILGVPSVAVAERAPQLIQAISMWKDHGVRSHSSTFARLLLQALQQQTWWSKDFIVVSIPDKRTSIRRRGYSPMADVLRELNRRADTPQSSGEVTLQWTRKVHDQRHLTSQQRINNVAGAIEASVVGVRPILVIDDVVTSGATLRSAVTALQDAGVSRVCAATIVSSRSSKNWD
ncbi:MAG: hypothetical protein RIS75_1000 [Actinomycetota bacterium]|jgi:predicted amidophosphoribosyltransferase